MRVLRGPVPVRNWLLDPPVAAAITAQTGLVASKGSVEMLQAFAALLGQQQVSTLIVVTAGARRAQDTFALTSQSALSVEQRIASA